ncbi:hypothetical protein GIY23_16460 [Allosaccharopolyspora coralli]|uniref:YbaB/EbfC family DNA-binding protein n=1 Tax=Allosaccharopolyspora coralli TaxID=2665642 RepID=A0A5Q3QH96_9PSEU|nr:YbaB/EbfC family nucleoid-associated protein [Allosaccharopolyspora coralli]QGK70895.1 hypothetical protein GIY23_16460 [Allosaccharopolyspora coralli]
MSGGATLRGCEELVASPQEWLDSLQQRADEMVQQSQQLQAQLHELAETASDGGVSVTVGSNGALKDLQLDQRSLRRGPEELQATILRLAREAQARVAPRVAQIVEPVTGASGAEFLRSQLPADVEADRDVGADQADDDGDEQPETFLR